MNAPDIDGGTGPPVNPYEPPKTPLGPPESPPSGAVRAARLDPTAAAPGSPLFAAVPLRFGRHGRGFRGWIDRPV